jgi:hypothetical protein
VPVNRRYDVHGSIFQTILHCNIELGYRLEIVEKRQFLSDQAQVQIIPTVQ